MNAVTSEQRIPALSLGPVQYFWSRDFMLDFYARVADWPVDIVYLGEVVCAKRRALGYKDWLEVGNNLTRAGKQVYLSTMTLIEAASELGALRRLCRNSEFPVEANDIAAVYQLSQLGKSFVTGPAINVYNSRTLNKLTALGLQRWVLPLELGFDTLRDMRDMAPDVQCEVFAWGRMPLAWSARCYTARSAGLAKDECGLLCAEDPDGRLIHTREDKPFLALNGIQTQSALTQNLAPHMGAMRSLGIDVLRLSPQAHSMGLVVRAFDELRRADTVPEATLQRLDELAPVATCDGYWRGGAGFDRLEGTNLQL